MTPISKELSEQIEREAAHYSAVQYGDPAKMQGLREIAAFDHGVEDYTAGATTYAHYKERCEELERWKREADALLSPLLDYGQNKEANIPLGASITTVILQRAKRFEEARKVLEEIAELPISHPVGFAKAIAGEALASRKDEGNDTPGKAGRICCDCGTFVTSGACPECCPMG